jgi:low temperature requirement protein LtrA
MPATSRVDGAEMARNLLLMFGAFVLASALAGALGATNLGTALAFGQMAFAASTVYVLLKR